ncbi:HD-like signal output (HDOD) domain, no enzymatic activity [Amphritea atlantica]|uniref:HD-like signal output (HDOD) domain, no enzymatic activity n=2 Tax=Amphritea atlantica TaxID=355243 RepID=A0A1H9EWC2_9GAMM|nr:HD-like signal output (HDOD) domain, no enzymatic activity [Amphritea atlantica]
MLFGLFGRKKKNADKRPKPTSRSSESASKPSRPFGQLLDEPADEATSELSQEMYRSLTEFNLFVASYIDEQQAARAQQLCEKLPDPNPVQAKLAGGLDTPQELVATLAADPGLTAEVLRTVNSAAFSLTSPISSVQHAVNYLGVSFVKGLVSQAATADQTKGCSEAQRTALQRAWLSTAVASAFANLLGQNAGHPRPSVLATKALFFNLGDLGFILGEESAHTWYAEGMTVLDRIKAQQQGSGLNAAIVGSTLARSWGLPEDIERAIANSMLPLVKTPAQLPRVLQEDELKDTVLLYLAARIGDRVAYRGLRDLSEFNLEAEDEPGIFFLKNHLDTSDQKLVIKLLSDTGFRNKFNRLLSTLAI